MSSFLALYFVSSTIGLIASDVEPIEELVDVAFPHHEFDCDPRGHTYETTFTFLQGLGRGFVHAEPSRIYFEYYFPAEHWVGFGAADQSIEGETDACTQCYFEHYYPLQNTNFSNLYPLCIEECLDDTIFVATVNSDEQNLNDWNIIEFQIIAQKSKALHQKMYRIPPPSEILDLWGSELYPYRENAHFSSDIYKIGQGDEEKEFVHAKFWRKYDFVANNDDIKDANEWKVFVSSPDSDDANIKDSLCFISVASFFGGEYPFDDTALNHMLPGFYIDTELFSNIHCFKRNDIKVDCGQDWSFLTETNNENHQKTATKKEENDGGDNVNEQEIEIADDHILDKDVLTNKPTVSPTVKPRIKSTQKSIATEKTTSMQPRHGEDCCSAISQISYAEIDCLNISQSDAFIKDLELRWKNEQCGRKDRLPTDLSVGIAKSLSNDSDCDHLWAYFNQIHELCFKFDFVSNSMKIYNHFKSRGGYECFDKNTDECKVKEESITNQKSLNFNNYDYDSDNNDNDIDFKVLNGVNVTQKLAESENESEMAQMEEDGGLTVTSLGVLGMIIFALTAYVLYWFCCSASSKGYRQHGSDQYGYYDDDIDTDDYQTRYRQKEVYNERINGSYDEENNDESEEDNDKDSDWSEDEQLGVAEDESAQIEMSENKTKKKKKKKKKKKGKKNVVKNESYDLSVNDVDSMPIHQSDEVEMNMNDAVEVNVENDHGNGDYDQYYEQMNDDN